MQKAKPILIFPYHDPDKVFFDVLIKKLSELQKTFGGVCVSVTQQTYKRHDSIPVKLEEMGCFVVKNKKNSVISDHYLNGLKLYREKIGNGAVYFGFVDRILFALCLSYRKKFITDVSKIYNSDMIIFSRSKKAWETHPIDYHVSEKIVEDIGWSFLRKRFDWAWCGAALSEKAVGVICSKKSDINDFAIETDWILSCMREGCTISSMAIDWLSWEDPFWAKRRGKKISRTLTTQQKLFRLKYNIHSLELIQDYFKDYYEFN